MPLGRRSTRKVKRSAERGCRKVSPSSRWNPAAPGPSDYDRACAASEDGFGSMTFVAVTAKFAGRRLAFLTSVVTKMSSVRRLRVRSYTGLRDQALVPCVVHSPL